MYLLAGNLRMECCDYEGAMQSFERARAQMRHHTSRPLFVISLVSFQTVMLRPIEITPSDRCPDGNLIISALRFNRVCVMPYMQPVAPRMRSSVSTK